MSRSSHFKCSGTDNRGKSGDGAGIDRRSQGARPRCRLRFLPLCRGLNRAEKFLPQWVQLGGVPAMLARLSRPRFANGSVPEIARDGLKTGAGSLRGTVCGFRSHRTRLQDAGQNDRRAPAELAADPIDALCDYLVDDEGATGVLVILIGEDDSDHRGLAVRAGRFGRHRRRALRHRGRGHAATRASTALSAHPQPLCARRECACRSSARFTR